MKTILMILTGLVLTFSSNVGLASNVNTKEATEVIKGDIDVMDLSIVDVDSLVITDFNTPEVSYIENMETFVILGCGNAELGGTTVSEAIANILKRGLDLPKVILIKGSEISEYKDINILVTHKPTFKELSLFERWEKEYVNDTTLTNGTNLFREQDLYEPVAFENLSPKDIFTNKRIKWIKGKYPKIE